MKVKLNKNLVDKYSFPLGGDMSETIGIAVNHEGKPITYEEFKKIGGTVKAIHVLEIDGEFLVVDHNNPITRTEYNKFIEFYKNN